MLTLKRRTLPLLAAAALLAAAPAGAAASSAAPGASASAAMPDYNFTMTSPKPGRLVVRGTISPSEAALDANVTLYRATNRKGVYVQLAYGTASGPKGKFRFAVKDERPGRHRYYLQIVPDEQSQWESLQETRAVKIKRKGAAKGKRGARKRAQAKRRARKQAQAKRRARKRAQAKRGARRGARDDSRSRGGR